MSTYRYPSAYAFAVVNGPSGSFVYHIRCYDAVYHEDDADDYGQWKACGMPTPEDCSVCRADACSARMSDRESSESPTSSADCNPDYEPKLTKVSLIDQYRRLTEPGRMDRALNELRADLDRREYRERIKALAVEGLIEGHEKYGDATCHLSEDEAQREADHEIRDAIVYLCIGGMA